MGRTWIDKANDEIAKMCAWSYAQANRMKNGKLRKSHVPYAVPLRAQQLVECLRTNDEHRAKSIFMELAVIPGVEREM